MEERTPRVRRPSVIPQPPFTRPILFGALAAALGAAAWGMMAFHTHTEHGVLAWAIGGAIGFAMVRAGGHGAVLGCCAGTLAVLTIASGKQTAFRMFVDSEATAFVAHLDAAAHEARGKDAAAWVALGEAPTNATVTAFQQQHEFDPVAPAHFVRTVGAELRSFAARKPSLEQWRDEVAAQFRDEASFVDYLREDFHPFDVLFVVLGVITAFGMLSKATVTLRAAAQAAEAEAAAAPAGDGANEPPRA